MSLGSNWPGMLAIVVAIATPIFAAGGAWASVRFALKDISDLKHAQARLASRLANLYGYLRVPFPPSDSID